MKKILLNNLSLKLLALLLGIILWIAVMYSLNPMTTKTITVPVNILYESVLTERDWMYTVQGKREAEVTVKAKSIDLAKITEDDIYLYADFRYLEGSSTERRATISYQLKNSAIESLVFVGNNYLTINLEEVITREFDVDVQISGSVAENYTADKEPTAVPKTITVKGPKSQVQRIAKVVYYLYIKDANEDIKESGAPTLLDAAGDVLTDLENVTITPETVDIVLPIYQTKNVKLVVDTDTITGTPATGYALSGVTLSKESVQIAGYRDIIAGMTSISIPGNLIDITGREDSLITEIDLDAIELPEGISLIGNDRTVIATAKIEKKKQSNYRLKLDDDVKIENKQDGYTYKFADSSIYITVEGISEVIANLEAANIIASIDVSGCVEGDNSVRLSVILPEDITLVNADAGIYVALTMEKEETSVVPPTDPPAPPAPPTDPPTDPPTETTPVETIIITEPELPSDSEIEQETPEVIETPEETPEETTPDEIEATAEA